jgi:hypothetical protein
MLADDTWLAKIDENSAVYISPCLNHVQLHYASMPYLTADFFILVNKTNK